MESTGLGNPGRHRGNVLTYRGDSRDDGISNPQVQENSHHARRVSRFDGKVSWSSRRKSRCAGTKGSDESPQAGIAPPAGSSTRYNRFTTRSVSPFSPSTTLSLAAEATFSRTSSSRNRISVGLPSSTLAVLALLRLAAGPSPRAARV